MSNPENSSYSGVVITAIVQFSMDMTIEKYLNTWNSLSNNDQELLEWKIGDSKLESKSDLMLEFELYLMHISTYYRLLHQKRDSPKSWPF